MLDSHYQWHAHTTPPSTPRSNDAPRLFPPTLPTPPHLPPTQKIHAAGTCCSDAHQHHICADTFHTRQEQHLENPDTYIQIHTTYTYIHTHTHTYIYIYIHSQKTRIVMPPQNPLSLFLTQQWAFRAPIHAPCLQHTVTHTQRNLFPPFFVFQPRFNASCVEMYAGTRVRPSIPSVRRRTLKKPRVLYKSNNGQAGMHAFIRQNRSNNAAATPPYTTAAAAAGRGPA